MNTPGGSRAETLRVSRRPGGAPEIFYSLQGEGPALGTPSVFLRLALCNLVCTWCDTKYTWDWRNHDYRKEVVELTHERVQELVEGHGCRHMVITGGEPLLQQRALAPLVGSLKDRGFSFEVETNGTILPGPELAPHIDQWNVSPKLANSGNSPHRREVPRVLHAFSAMPNAYFKFVVVEPGDVEEVEALVGTYGLDRARVLLMPEGRTKRQLQDRSGWLSEVCVEKGFRFTPRLHVLLWGDERGR